MGRLSLALALALVAATVTNGTVADAQRSPRAKPAPPPLLSASVRGVRALPAERYDASPGMSYLLTPTVDGLLEMAVDSRYLAQPVMPREPRVPRAFYEPEAVLAWADSVDGLLTRIAQRQGSVGGWYQPVELGKDRGRTFTINGSVDASGASVSIYAQPCNGNTSAGLTVDPQILRGFLVAVRAAARVALKQPGRREEAAYPVTVDDHTYWAHAVSCPASPVAANAEPRFPSMPLAERTPYEVLTEFVVDTSGKIELPTVRVARGTDARFEAAVRAVLPGWRFQPAIRLGARVRQVVHLAVPFEPPVVGTTPLRALLYTGEARFTPLDDGTVELAFFADRSFPLLLNEVGVARDVLSAQRLRAWLDSVPPALAIVAESLGTHRGSGAGAATVKVPPLPMLGFEQGRGLYLPVVDGGAVRGGVWCEGWSAGAAIELGEVASFATVARNALARGVARRATPRGRPYFEHEVACPAMPLRTNTVPTFETRDTTRTSVEVLVRFVVDTSGRVLAPSLTVVTPIEAPLGRLVRDAVPRWRFRAAMRGGRRVAQVVHTTLVMRPIVRTYHPVLAQDARRPVAHTGRATVFYQPAPRVESSDRPVGSTSWTDWNEAVRAMQPYVDKARDGWPGVRQRYVDGLATGEKLFVTARLRDSQARVEQVFIEVTKVSNGRIEGTITTNPGVVGGYHRGDRYLLAEAELVDWTIVKPDGSEEGNVVGRFLDTYRPSR